MEQIISLHSLDKLSPSCMFPSLALQRSTSEGTIYVSLIKERVNGWRRTAEPGDAAAADRKEVQKCRKENATAKRASTYLWFLNHFHRPQLVQTVHAELSLGPEYSSATCASSTCGNMQRF